jgi:periplasmic mercuric ion binding protein
MKILSRFAFLALAILIFQSETAHKSQQLNNIAHLNLSTKKLKVLGNCGMCQRIIEKSAIQAGATKANWNWDTDVLVVTFDPAKTSTDAILKEIAANGYDNEAHKASDEVYNKLHGCCQYDRSGLNDGQKSCAQRLLENAEKKKKE